MITSYIIDDIKYIIPEAEIRVITDVNLAQMYLGEKTEWLIGAVRLESHD